jgi:hypothetical protein|tara:strand:- start:3297 stop:4535 length:1239 start_codon:yes stop_codon:yes gene_type:complete
LRDAFSLCYGGFDGGGAVSFGKVPQNSLDANSLDPNQQNASLSVSLLKYTPLVRNPAHPSYYTVTTAEWRLGMARVAAEGDFSGRAYGTVLDSGTTFTYVPTPVFTSFKTLLDGHIASDKKLVPVPGPDPDFPEDVCYGVAALDGENLHESNSAHDLRPTEKTLQNFFPNLTLAFVGELSLNLPPGNYLFIHGKIDNAFCLGVMDNGESGTLVGGITTRNVLVEYDMDANGGGGAVGLAVTDCAAMLAEHGTRGGGGDGANDTNSSDATKSERNNNTERTGNATDGTGGAEPSTSPPPPPPVVKEATASVAPTGFIALLCLIALGVGVVYYGKQSGWLDTDATNGGAGGAALRTAVTAAKKGNDLFQEKWNELKQTAGRSSGGGYARFGLDDDRPPKGHPGGVELPPLLPRR